MTIFNTVHSKLVDICSFEGNMYKISYSWLNFIGTRVNVSTTIAELYRDWHNEASLCPENDEPLVGLEIANQKFAKDEIDGMTFGELMTDIEAIWKARNVPLCCQDDLDMNERMLTYIRENFSVSREFYALAENILTFASNSYPNLDEKILFLRSIFDETIGLTEEDYQKIFA